MLALEAQIHLKTHHSQQVPVDDPLADIKRTRNRRKITQSVLQATRWTYGSRGGIKPAVHGNKGSIQNREKKYSTHRQKEDSKSI